MSKFYSDQHRALQDRFDTRSLAQMMEHGIVHAEFSPEERSFIETRDMFFLSTLDIGGRPTVSYKGGAAGFVRITGAATLVFPCYDGNGMFYSMGNIMTAPEVGLLFIDFETPNRLRIQGRASVSFDDPQLEFYPEAQCLATVAVDQIWVNCPRYVHRYQKVATSRYVPTEGRETPMPTWKRIDIVQSALSPADQAKVDLAGGQITQDHYTALLEKGQA